MRTCRTLLVAAALALAPSLAAATDFMDTSTPTPMYGAEPGFSWDGFYAGVLGGVYFEGTDHAFTVSKLIGFNIVNGQLLIGAEVEGLGGFGWTGGGPSNFAVFSGRGRVGLLASDDVLIYGSVGFDKFNTSPSVDVSVGAGAEFALADSATARLDFEGLAYGGSFYAFLARGGFIWHFD